MVGATICPTAGSKAEARLKTRARGPICGEPNSATLEPARPTRRWINSTPPLPSWDCDCQSPAPALANALATLLVCLRSSNLAIWLRWTSSGPSASRNRRAVA